MNESDIWSEYGGIAHFEVTIWPLLLESSKVAASCTLRTKVACKFCLQAWDLFFWVKLALSRWYS